MYCHTRTYKLHIITVIKMGKKIRKRVYIIHIQHNYNN